MQQQQQQAPGQQMMMMQQQQGQQVNYMQQQRMGMVAGNQPQQRQQQQQISGHNSPAMCPSSPQVGGPGPVQSPRGMGMQQQQLCQVSSPSPAGMQQQPQQQSPNNQPSVVGMNQQMRVQQRPMPTPSPAAGAMMQHSPMAGPMTPGSAASPMPSPHANAGHVMLQSSSPRGMGQQQQHSADQADGLSPFSPAMASPQPVAGGMRLASPGAAAVPSSVAVVQGPGAIVGSNVRMMGQQMVQNPVGTGGMMMQQPQQQQQGQMMMRHQQPQQQNQQQQHQMQQVRTLIINNNCLKNNIYACIYVFFF